MKRPIFFAAAILVFLLSACSLAEDITPPPDYQAPTQNTAATVYPIVPPDLVRGAAIFSEKCAPCHGDLGRGNGSMASNLSVEVPAIGTSEVALSAIPVDWFNLVTNGRMERSMPPFKSLDDRDRWDVVAYALSLHTTQVQLDSAKAIYEQQCQSCHGRQGKGDGEQAAGQNMPDWSQPERLAQLSEEKLFQSITTGIGSMPAYRDTLSDEQRLGLAAYVRSLTFASPGTLAASISTPTPVPTAESTAASGTVSTAAATGEASTGSTLDGTPTAEAAASQVQKTTITGKITSASGTLPTGLKATLRAFDGMVAADSQTVPVAADGSYSFADIELVENRVFMVTVTVDGVDYNSDPLHSSDVTPGQPANLPITIYEKSNDVTLLRGDRLHVFFDFTDTQKVQVVELLIFSNAGQKVIAPAKEGDTLLNFKLPAGATDLQFQDGTLGDGVYLQTADGFGVSQSYTPAEGYQILFAYNLPYDRKGNFEFYVPIDVAEAIVMVPQEGVRMKSDQLTDAGSRPVQGINLQLYTTSNLTPDNALKLSLSGRPAQGATVNSGSTTTMLIGIGAFVLVGATGAAFYINHRRKKSEPEEIQEEETPETLMDAIITLDDQRRAGELSEEAYISRRSELKQRLQRLTGQSQDKKDAA
ncbi:MAG TPA: c-type cytochrome [Longilinea sp.]|nr:c-type cytochrome [Longilinea sp.]